VFACAAAIAALQELKRSRNLISGLSFVTGNSAAIKAVPVNLLEPPEIAEIPIEQRASLGNGRALAITRSDPGDNLDLTRNTPVWALVEWADPDPNRSILFQGGEGVGQIAFDGMGSGEPAIYDYAKRLFYENLRPQLQGEETIRVTIILPEGRALAKRTSNEAFGVVEGLSLLGTSGISQPLSTPGQLVLYREALQQRRSQFDCLVFCVGENGLDCSQKLGIDPQRLVKTANWLGPMLVEAGLQGVESILLFGYHGKLIKLAGGIFHTHHHLADGRLEILTAHGANAGLPTPALQAVFTCPTAEAALQCLRGLDLGNGEWVNRVYGAIAETIDRRSQAYIQAHSDRTVQVGSILFDRNRNIITQSQTGQQLLQLVKS
jgi:cobalt-precorrin-5B (C1)-methyltransferase